MGPGAERCGQGRAGPRDHHPGRRNPRRTRVSSRTASRGNNPGTARVLRGERHQAGGNKTGQAPELPEPARTGFKGISPMPRQRVHHGGSVYVFPEGFPERLRRFQRESGLSWSEIARRIGTYRHTVSRWKEGLGHPNLQHRRALMELAEALASATLHQSSADSGRHRVRGSETQIGPTHGRAGKDPRSCGHTANKRKARPSVERAGGAS